MMTTTGMAGMMINWKIMVNGNDFLDEREKKNEEGEERAAEWQEDTNEET